MASDDRARARMWFVVIGSFLLLGALSGVLWHAWWAPAPVGVVVEGQVYFPPDEAFAATATYMLVATPAGLLLGSLLAHRHERDEVATLFAVLVGAVLAGVLMAGVGHLIGPEDADAVAARADDFAEIRGDLAPGPLPAYAAFPGGALVGVVLVLVTFTRRRVRRPADE